jgi:hypothetical protein
MRRIQELTPALRNLLEMAIRDYDTLWYSLLDDNDREMTEERMISGSMWRALGMNFAR